MWLLIDLIVLSLSAKAERDTRWQELHSYPVNSSQHYIQFVFSVYRNFFPAHTPRLICLSNLLWKVCPHAAILQLYKSIFSRFAWPLIRNETCSTLLSIIYLLHKDVLCGGIQFGKKSIFQGTIGRLHNTFSSCTCQSLTAAICFFYALIQTHPGYMQECDR